MNHINLDLYSPFHKTGHTSKGDQRKWEIDGIWYKADYMGYEGLAEYMISHLLAEATLSKEEYVLYEPVEIKYKANIYSGVKSKYAKEVYNEQ